MVPADLEEQDEMAWGDGPGLAPLLAFGPATWTPLKQLPDADVRVFAFASPFSKIARL